MDNPSEKYYDIRERCMKANRTVPTRILRAHLDFVRAVQRMQPGLYPMVITIGRNADPKSIDLFPQMDRSDVIIRVGGQHYGVNNV